MRTRSVLLLGLLAVFLPVAAHAAGRCEPDGVFGDAVLAAREALRASCDCTAAASHAAYVDCARAKIRDLADTGSLPRMCRARMMQYAVRSTCGRSDLSVCCESNDASHVFAVIREKGACRTRRGATCVGSFPHLEEACVKGTICRGSSCGDGIVEPNTEQCEPPNTQTCDDQCYIRHDCGNGVVDAAYGEQCEPPGAASCDAQCRFIHTCGNGVIEPGEECDGQPACNGDCLLTRSLCCDLAGVCFDGTATDVVSEYQFAKGCSYIVGGQTSHGVCQGTEQCPPPAAPGIGCLVGSCGDEPIDPLPLCCQHPDGTCTGSNATTAGAIGGCGFGTFPPPAQGDVEHLMLGTCGDDGRCVPLASGGSTP